MRLKGLKKIRAWRLTQLIEGFSESIKMLLYEHRLDNLPSEKARKGESESMTSNRRDREEFAARPQQGRTKESSEGRGVKTRLKA
jgi:hypothetical protein